MLKHTIQLAKTIVIMFCYGQNKFTIHLQQKELHFSPQFFSCYVINKIYLQIYHSYVLPIFLIIGIYDLFRISKKVYFTPITYSLCASRPPPKLQLNPSS
jgi:hypothetical protein